MRPLEHGHKWRGGSGMRLYEREPQRIGMRCEQRRECFFLLFSIFFTIDRPRTTAATKGEKTLSQSTMENDAAAGANASTKQPAVASTAPGSVPALASQVEQRFDITLWGALGWEIMQMRTARKKN